MTLAGERQISNAASAAAPDLIQLFLAATTADSKIQSLQQEIERLREQLQKQKQQQQQQSKIQPVQEIQSQTSASPASVSSETPSASVAAAQENKTRTEEGEELVEEEERKQRRFLPIQEELDTSTKFGQQVHLYSSSFVIIPPLTSISLHASLNRLLAQRWSQRSWLSACHTSLQGCCSTREKNSSLLSSLSFVFTQTKRCAWCGRVVLLLTMLDA